jgi:hypothetical protein
VEMTGYRGISGSKARTVAAWIKTDDAGVQFIASWGKEAIGRRWLFYINNSGNLYVSVYRGYMKTTNLDLRDGAWHHVAVVLPHGSSNVEDVKLYVSGQEQTSTSFKSREISTAGSTDVTIGVNLSSDKYFDGLIDDVRIYSRALDANEITTLAGL